jgi:hypothetical protein
MGRHHLTMDYLDNFNIESSNKYEKILKIEKINLKNFEGSSEVLNFTQKKRETNSIK